jgi:hypothetical protein
MNVRHALLIAEMPAVPQHLLKMYDSYTAG